jgi:hypothetical protein
VRVDELSQEDKAWCEGVEGAEITKTLGCPIPFPLEFQELSMQVHAIGVATGVVDEAVLQFSSPAPARSVLPRRWLRSSSRMRSSSVVRRPCWSVFRRWCVSGRKMACPSRVRPGE